MFKLTAGYGVFATKVFSRGDFLLEYVGRMMTSAEGFMVDDQTYIYHFYYKSKKYW